MQTRFSLILALSLVVMLVAASRADADLDRSFGGDGRVVTPLELPGPIWYAGPVRSAAVADGGIAAAAGSQVLRYRSDGSLDRGFGEGGRALIPVPAEAEFSLAAVAVDPEGDTVVAGTALFRGDPLQDPSSEPPPISDFRREAMIVRFDPHGDLDRGFGAGGVLLTPFGKLGIYDDSGRTYDDPGVGVSDMAIDSQGRIVVAGSFVYRVEPCGAGLLSLEAGYLVRLLPNGAMDPSFGEGGKTIEGSLKSIGALALDPEDNPFVVGTANHACVGGPILLFAFRANGEHKTDFGRSGRTQAIPGFGAAESPSTSAGARSSSAAPSTPAMPTAKAVPSCIPTAASPRSSG